MAKIIITGNENNGYRYRYSFVKGEEFKEFFIRFMGKIGFEKKKVRGYFTSTNKEENEFQLKIKNFNDCCEFFENGNYEIDLFFGAKKIIML